MSHSERHAMWQERIQSFKESGEPSVAAWCRENQINVKSMYSWLKKDINQQDRLADTEIPHVNWVPVNTSTQASVVSPSTTITVKLGQFALEIGENFNQDVFNDVLEVLHRHVK